MASSKLRKSCNRLNCRFSHPIRCFETFPLSETFSTGSHQRILSRLRYCTGGCSVNSCFVPYILFETIFFRAKALIFESERCKNRSVTVKSCLLLRLLQLQSLRLQLISPYHLFLPVLHTLGLLVSRDRNHLHLLDYPQHPAHRSRPINSTRGIIAVRATFQMAHNVDAQTVSACGCIWAAAEQE